MISAIIFLNQKGETVLVRNYRGDIRFLFFLNNTYFSIHIFFLIPILITHSFCNLSIHVTFRRSTSEAFRNAIIVKKNTKFPLVQIGKACFFYIREGNLYLAACSNLNCNASVVFETLHRMVEVFKSYFDGEFNETILFKNAGLIYELLDGLPSFSFPILDISHRFSLLHFQKLLISATRKPLILKF